MMVRTAVSADEPAIEEGIKAAKKPRVPDFNSLQKKVFLGVGALGVIIVLFLLQYWFKSANVIIYAKGSKLPVNFSFTADPATKQSDAEKGILGASTLQSSHDVTATATATGKKDVGTKASGMITITNYCYNPGTLAAGTTFTSGGGLKFVSTAAVIVPDGTIFAGVCQSKQTTVSVTASQNGDQYNLAPTGYSVSGIPSSGSSYMTFQGNQMSGGTSKQITVLTQADIDKAKTEAAEKDKETSKKDLENKAGNEQHAFVESFEQKIGTVTSSQHVDAETNSSSITVALSYSMLAVSKDDLKEMVKVQEQKQVTEANQIYDDGLAEAKITPAPKDAAGRQTFNLSTEAFAGAKIDPKALAELLKGLKYGDAADTASKQAGVDHVEISLFPAWSTKLPSISNHIKIEIKAATKQ
jgi:hypothetical protein